MPSPIQFTFWHWAAFIVVVLFFLALDLGIFHKEARVVKFKEAFLWSLLWFGLSGLFALGLVHWSGRDDGFEFFTGYLIELSLSMDNVFVIALIFGVFRVPQENQHRVLFWGILGALVMRGFMIGVGATLIQHFHSILYVVGAFLIYTGVKMTVTKQEDPDPEKNPVVRIARKFFPVTTTFEGQKFFSMVDGRKALTPLALVLIMVETTDLIFAVDSIPAIFAVTEKPFIVFTSNVFAILGLRSLYFALADAIRYFRYLKFGLSVVLIFIGTKMLLAKWKPIPIGLSLLAVAGIILVSIVASLISVWREKKSNA